MFDNTVFTEDDILEDCAKLETDASSDEDATEEVTASDTVDDMRSVLLVDKVTVGIAEDGVIGRIVEDGVRDDISDDNETDEEIADNCWEDTADVCSDDDKITEELDNVDSGRDDDDDKNEDIEVSDELLTTEELVGIGAGVII